jgi:hypothetical protein
MDEEPAEDDEAENEDIDADDGEQSNGRGKKTKVLWIEEIPPHRFYLRVGLGRKASGSYYTPHSFVRFLVQETLGPQVEERSPQNDPKPLEILKLKVLDPAMGSGHFLVEACRFLGEKLYEACRSCDEKAIEAERQAESARTDQKRAAALESAQNWRQRIIELPDPDDELAKTEFAPRESKEQALEPVTAYLPSTSLSPGVSTSRAQAICRRLVAVHCLYGVDKNPLAVELAKLALWLESHAEGMPLTFLDHRLVAGDSLTGPFWDELLFRPGKPDTPVENLFSQGIYSKLQKSLTEALALVHRLESSVGSDIADLLDKEAVKGRLDKALLPFRVAVAAWAGGVILGPERCDDLAYAQFLKSIGEVGRITEAIKSDALRAQIARGLGLASVPEDRPGLEGAVISGQAIPALSFDLTFPEVFYTTGVPHGKQGFHAVLGNPPWDALQPLAKEFFAAYDFEIMAAPTRREREVIERRLLTQEDVSRAYKEYADDIEKYKTYVLGFFPHVNKSAQGNNSGAITDLWQCFAERSSQLLRPGGYLGIVLPSAFHANESATGIRDIFLNHMGFRRCYSFENRRKLFEIHRSFKFATVVAQAGKTTEAVSCAFYLHDDEWLFGSRLGREPLDYSLAFIRRTGGDYLCLSELRTRQDFEVAEACFEDAIPLGSIVKATGLTIGVEADMSKDAWRFTSTASVVFEGEDPRDPDVAGRLLEQGYLVLHEGKTFRQYDDHWSDRPRYLVRVESVKDRHDWLENSRYYRVSHRGIAGPGDENVSIWCVLPYGVICGNKAPAERGPWNRCSSHSLWLIGLGNSTVFDWLLSLRVRATVNAFISDSVPAPAYATSRTLITHGSLRLTANHAGYARLWQEQLGNQWREPIKAPFTWPVLATDNERWHVRAAIDAVVADAYGLSHDQYAHVLSTFKHTNYSKAPELCLARFDELKAIGLDAFTKKHDPYWDIPLNENLSQPVIDLPVAEAEQSTVGDPALGPQFRLSDKPARQRAKRKR